MHRWPEAAPDTSLDGARAPTWLSANSNQIAAGAHRTTGDSPV